MSGKRQATTQLTAENWDQDDPTEQDDETGGFKLASKEVLDKRVIRTARRRTQATDDEAKKSVFSGFSGFNKAQKTSFDFLANLADSKNTNNGTVKCELTDASSPSTIKAANSSNIGLFGAANTSTPIAKSTFGKPNPESLIFGSTPTSPSLFTPKLNTVENASPFKVQPTPNPISSDLNSKFSNNTEKSVSQTSPSIFGSSLAGNASPKSLYTNSSNASPFTTQPAKSSQSIVENNTVTKKESAEDKKLIYYNKLKGLNQSVSAWIKKHVEETPLCILTPIFTDYEKHLSEIQDEYEKSKKTEEKRGCEITETKQTSELPPSATKSLVSPFSAAKPSSFLSSNPINTENSSNFKFGSNTSTVSPTNTFSTSVTPSVGFSFGIKPLSSNSSSLSLSTTPASSQPFSFGTGKPFSFNANIKKPEETSNETEENDEPPKVAYTPIVEENSVYDKKCKVFVKKDGNFVDKGVGTLYVKKIEDSGKHQLLVRANTTLGNILLNFILSSTITSQRMGKNNVMMVCIPTPEAQPPPIPILLRVKTSEEADELLDTLNKFKA